MPLTKAFRETVQARAARDPAFRKALFQETVQLLLQGDVDAGRAAMRNYINATTRDSARCRRRRWAGKVSE